MRLQGGFTIIELMVAVAVLGVLIGIAVPSFTDSIARRRLEGVATELNTDFQYARAQAISTNSTITLTATATGYTIAGVANLKTLTIANGCILSAESLPATFSFEANRGAPTFTPPTIITLSGAASLSAACNNTSATLRVDVSALGVVQMCSPNGSFGGYSAC